MYACKFIWQNFFWGKGYLWESCNKLIWAKKCTINKFVRILTNGKKLRNYYFLYSIIRLIILESSFDFNTNIQSLIILKMLLLIISTTFNLMLVLVSANFFGNLSWKYKHIIYYVPKTNLFWSIRNFYSTKLQWFFSLAFSSFT